MSRPKLGGWVLKGKVSESEAFYYVAQIPADTAAEDLGKVLVSVAKSADEFEQELEATGLADDKKDTY